MQNKILYSGGPGVTIQSSRGNAVLGNAIQYSAGTAVTATAGRNNLIGSATAGAGQPGLYVTGVVTGTQVQGNAISGNTGDGVMLVKARTADDRRQLVGGRQRDRRATRATASRRYGRVLRLRGARERDRGERQGERQPDQVPRHHVHPEVDIPAASTSFIAGRSRSGRAGARMDGWKSRSKNVFPAARNSGH